MNDNQTGGISKQIKGAVRGLAIDHDNFEVLIRLKLE